MGKKFLQRIDKPEDEKLKELLKIAIAGCKEKLNEENVEFSENNIKKFANTFYYDWEKDGKPKYIFPGQNPGLLQIDRHFGKKIYELKESDSCVESIHYFPIIFFQEILQKAILTQTF